MAAKKKRAPVVALDPSDFEPGDVTRTVYPDGVPTNPDGSVAPEGTPMTLERGQTLGAINAEAAQYNKKMGQRADAKAKGGTNIPWNETRALHLFDLVRLAFQAATIQICIKDLETQVEYQPVRMSMLKTSDDLYKHLANIQRGKSMRLYELTYKDIQQFSNRGTGTIMMPDMIDEVPAAPQPQPNPYLGQLPPWGQHGGGYPPPGYGPGGGYGPPQGGYYPPPQAAPPAPVAAAPAPAPAPAPQYMQPPPQIVIPPGVDPNVAALLQQMVQDQRQGQRSLEVMQMQLAASLGGLEEFKRMTAQQAMNPVAQPAAAPPPPAPPAVDPYRTAGPPSPPMHPPPAQVFLGYGANGQAVYGYPAPQPQPAPTLAAPPPPPAPVQALKRELTPAEQMTNFAMMMASTVKSIEDVKKAVNHGQPPPMGMPQAEVDDEPPTPEPPPIGTMALGTSPNDPIYVHNPDGSPHWTGIMMANLPKIPAFLNSLAGAVSKVGNAVDEVEHRRPISAVGQVVNTPHAQPQQVQHVVPRQVQHAPPPQQMAAPIPVQRAPMVTSIPVREP